MSTPQRTPVRVITVDRETAAVLRLQAKNVMVFGHDLFEDMLEFGFEAQYALSMRFRAACDVIDIVGWDPDAEVAEDATFEVPLTDDLVEQLRHRRMDLALTNVDRLPENNGPISAELLAEITVDRLAQGRLDRVFRAYAKAGRKA
jgi:hypothetical protein